MMLNFIDNHKLGYAIVTIWNVIIALSTHERAKDLRDNLKKHSLRDKYYISEIKSIQQDSKCRYGIRKV